MTWSRALAILPVEEGGVMPWGGWAAAMMAQEDCGRWDALIVDTTDRPSPEYLARFHEWHRSRPLGPHNVRLRCFSAEPMLVSQDDYRALYDRGDFRTFKPDGHAGEKTERPPDFGASMVGTPRAALWAPWVRTSWGRSFGIDLATGWSSYDAVLMCDARVLPEPGCLAALGAGDREWVASSVRGPLPDGQRVASPGRAVVTAGSVVDEEGEDGARGTHVCMTMVRRSAFARIGCSVEDQPSGLWWSLTATQPPRFADVTIPPVVTAIEHRAVATVI